MSRPGLLVIEALFSALVILPFCMLFAEAKPLPQALTLLAFGAYGLAHKARWPKVEACLTYAIFLAIVFGGFAAATYWILLAHSPVCDESGRCVTPLPHAIFALVSGSVAALLFAIILFAAPTRWPTFSSHLPQLVLYAGIACVLVATLWPWLKT